MKKVIFITALISSLSAFANPSEDIRNMLSKLSTQIVGTPQTYETLAFSYDPNSTYHGLILDSGWGPMRCGKITDHQPGPIPVSCYRSQSIRVPNDVLVYQLQQNLFSVVSSLSQEVKAYKDQIAQSHKDIIDTIVTDPQFLEALAKKIKETNK